MPKKTSLKSELAAQYLDYVSDFFDLAGMTAKEKKGHAKKFVENAQRNATDSSEAAVRAAFKDQLLEEGKLIIRSLTTAFAANAGPSVVLRAAPERTDLAPPPQPKNHTVPSQGGFPRY